MKKSFIICVLIYCVSCVNENNKSHNNNQTSKINIVKPADTELTAKLYSLYFAEPKNQEELDQNALLDYAVDHGLDVTRTNTGLFYIVHKEGKGPLLKRAQPTSAHYNGYFVDGKIFDSSYQKGRPINFNVGQMVPGWNEALLLMNAGTKAQILIPSRLAYGPKGFPGYVPPNTPIIFDIEVLPLGKNVN